MEDELDREIRQALRQWGDTVERSVPPWSPKTATLERPRPDWTRRSAVLAIATLLLVAVAGLFSLSRRHQSTIQAGEMMSDSTLGTAVPDTLDSAPNTPSTHSPPSQTGPEILASIGWLGARTAGESIVVYFVGGLESSSAPCSTTEYVAHVNESDTEVDVRITALLTPGDPCPDLGTIRSVVVSLNAPLSDRGVVVNGAIRSVVDEASLAAAPRLPIGYVPTRERPGPIDQSWTRVWGYTERGGTDCSTDAGAIELTEGTSELALTGGITQGEPGTSILLGSITARATTEPDGTLRMSWANGDRAFVIRALPTCGTALQPSLDDLLAIVEGLAIPVPSD